MTRIDAIRPPISAERKAQVNAVTRQIIVDGIGGLLPELLLPQCKQIGDLLQHRIGIRDYALDGHEYDSRERELIVASEIDELVWLGYDGVEEPFSKARKEQTKAELLQILAGQEYMLSGSNVIEAQIGEDAFIRIDYVPSNWEGIGQIRIAYKDSKTVEAYEANQLEDTSDYPLSAGYEPLYVVRGNPYIDEGGIRFDIRAIQAWAKDGYPAVSELRFLQLVSLRMRLGIEDVPQTHPELVLLDDLLQDRERASRRFAGRDGVINKGPAIKDEKLNLSMEDAVLLIAAIFLRKKGVQIVRGVSSFDQPAASEYRQDVDPSFSYDDLFNRWFYHQNDLVFPWVIADRGEGDYMKNLQSIPAGMRMILFAIWNA